MPLQIRYEGRELGSTALEVAIDETSATHHELIEPAGVALATFAIDPPRLVPCHDVPYQIAQKLHACTEPLPEGKDRVRDIIDIWLLEALLDPPDLAKVRSTPIETLRRRQNHRWPPIVTSSDSWARDYVGLITEHPDAPIDAAVDYLAGLIGRIDST